MDKEFEVIGKQMPYKVPAAFFADSEKKIIEKIKAENGTKKRKHILRILIPTVAVAAMLALILNFPVFRHTDNMDALSMLKQTDPVIYASSSLQTEMIGSEDSSEMDEFIESLSDEDLQDLVAQANGDLFLY